MVQASDKNRRALQLERGIKCDTKFSANKQICRIKGLRREREREERKKEKKLTTLRRIDGNALLTKGKMLVSRL